MLNTEQFSDRDYATALVCRAGGSRTMGLAATGSASNLLHKAKGCPGYSHEATVFSGRRALFPTKQPPGYGVLSHSAMPGNL